MSQKHIFLSMFVILLLSIIAPVDADNKRIATPLDFVTLRIADDPQVTPDGRRVAFVVREPGDPKKPEKPGDTNIWIVPSDGSEPARLFAASPSPETSPRWSPDGKYLAFLSDRGEPIGEEKEAKRQIYILRLDGGDAEALTTMAGGVEVLRWSTDGKAIAFTARDAPTEDERKREKEKDDRVYVDHEFKYARLFTVTLADRRVQQVTKQNLEVVNFAWSPDGAEIAAIVASTPRLDDVYWNSKLIVVKRTSGEITRTLSETAAVDNLEWSPDGKTIYFHDFTPNRIATLPVVVPATGGTLHKMLDGYPGTVWAAKWLPDSKQLIGEALEGTRQYIVRIDVSSGTIRCNEEAFGEGAAFCFSQDGGTVAYLKESTNQPSEVWISQAPYPPKCLTSLNPQVALLRLGTMEEITWKNPKDGRLIYGLVIKPPDYKQGKTYPTFIQVHGGPEQNWWMGWHGSFRLWGQLLASNGYVVLLPNPRGSDGQGWRFVEANRDDWGGADFQDILAGVDELIARKIADPARLGIGGWSYGGFMTSWAVTQTNRFKAAVVGAPVTDLFSFHGTTDLTPMFLKNYFLDLPYRRRLAYDKHSPISFAQNVKTPCLLIHGGGDIRAPVGQGMEFYQALKQLGVETEMVIYPREPHRIQERAHQLDLMTRVIAWYDRFLKR